MRARQIAAAGGARGVIGRERVLKQRHQLFVALLGGADALAVGGAAYAAWGLRLARFPVGQMAVALETGAALRANVNIVQERQGRRVHLDRRRDAGQ